MGVFIATRSSILDDLRESPFSDSGDDLLKRPSDSNGTIFYANAHMTFGIAATPYS